MRQVAKAPNIAPSWNVCGAATIRGRRTGCTLIDRSLPNVHPYGNLTIRRQGADKRLNQQFAYRGIARHLARHGRFGAAKAHLCRDLEKQLWEDVPFIPLGEYGV
jgi:hypothetical protein